MRLLHIIDDNKFIKFCKNTFDIDFVENFYLKSGEINTQYLIDNKINVIFIHFLREKEIDFFYKNNIYIPKVWMFWGGDGFSLPLFYNDFLDKESLDAREQIERGRDFRAYLKYKIKTDFKRIWNQSSYVRKKLKIINQMDYVVPVVPGDYYLLKEKYKIKTKLYHFNYVVDLIGTINDCPDGGNILLGNSASITNNQLSVLAKLNQMDLGNRKVYVPLSYGDEHYKKYVLDYIQKLHNEKIAPLIDFMPYEEYSGIINSCDVIIMNHHRQQGLGNIMLGLTSGCTIFMNERSSLFMFLKNKKFIIKRMSDIHKMEFLSDEQKVYNADLAKRIFSKERQLELVEKLLMVLN